MRNETELALAKSGHHIYRVIEAPCRPVLTKLWEPGRSSQHHALFRAAFVFGEVEMCRCALDVIPPAESAVGRSLSRDPGARVCHAGSV